MKRPDGVVVIAVYYALIALFFLLASCALLFALFAVLATVFEPTAIMWSVFGIGIGLLFCLPFLVGSALAAWGLLALKNWGRWVAIALGLLQLPAFPIWTVIGGLIIYYLLREDVRMAFEGRGPAPVMSAPQPVSQAETPAVPTPPSEAQVEVAGATEPPSPEAGPAMPADAEQQ